MKPKVIQKGSLLKNTKTNHLDHLLQLSHVDRVQKGSFFEDFWHLFRSFLEAPTKAPKNQHKRSIWRLWRPNHPQSDPRGSPKGCQNPSKIVAKSSLSRRGRPPATFDLKKWSRRGVPPQNTPKIDRKTHEIGRNFGRVWILGLTPKLKKNGGRSALYFIPFGVSEIRQSTGKISCGAKIQNHKISGRISNTEQQQLPHNFRSAA